MSFLYFCVACSKNNALFVEFRKFGFPLKTGLTGITTLCMVNVSARGKKVFHHLNQF